jgi:His/Glu/Gln/Arg/opine family amino acid ABC transporter permease subunit
MSVRPRSSSLPVPAFLRDIRVLQIIGQVVFVILLVTFFSKLGSDIVGSLQAKNLTPNLTFLRDRGGFDISEHPAWYSSDSSFGDAFVVGLINTIRVATVALVLTTVVGILLGICLLSRNWLVHTIARAYVEVLRNTPLLVQLFVWYFIVIPQLPTFQQTLAFPNEGIFLIPTRWIIYVVLLVIYWLWRTLARQRQWFSPTIDPFWLIIAAVVTLEIAFAMSGIVESWRNNVGMWVYLLVSVGLVAAAWVYGNQSRRLLVSIALGQIIGALVYFLGIASNNGIGTETYPVLFLNRRGFAFPQLLPTARFGAWAVFVVIGVALAIVLWRYLGRETDITGRPYPRGWYAFFALAGLMIVGWIVVGSQPPADTITVQKDNQAVTMALDDARVQNLLTLDDQLFYSRAPLYFVRPLRDNFKFTAGTQITPEYMALLLGLVVYTSAFIGEIVRGGIQAVPYGQIEAARALGLSSGQMLWLVILPQALRVIIPPLGNQYLNLTKNSSLAIAIGYADLFLVTQTIMNTSGQSVTGIFMVMMTYLAMSLTISLVMNVINRRFQLVIR